MRIDHGIPNTYEKNYSNESKDPLQRHKTSTATADTSQKRGRQIKAGDILVFDRIGKTGIFDHKGMRKTGMLFRGASNKPWTALFGRVKANSQDVYNIFRSNGMTPDQAHTALINVKNISKNMNLSGISSHEVEKALWQHGVESRTANVRLPEQTAKT